MPSGLITKVPLAGSATGVVLIVRTSVSGSASLPSKSADKVPGDVGSLNVSNESSKAIGGVLTGSSDASMTSSSKTLSTQLPFSSQTSKVIESSPTKSVGGLYKYEPSGLMISVPPLSVVSKTSVVIGLPLPSPMTRSSPESLVSFVSTLPSTDSLTEVTLMSSSVIGGASNTLK